MRVIRKTDETTLEELRRADIAIDQDDVVIKHRDDVVPRPATSEELELLRKSSYE